jgi:hypothetical protein
MYEELRSLLPFTEGSAESRYNAVAVGDVVNLDAIGKLPLWERLIHDVQKNTLFEEIQKLQPGAHRIRSVNGDVDFIVLVFDVRRIAITNEEPMFCEDEELEKVLQNERYNNYPFEVTTRDIREDIKPVIYNDADNYSKRRAIIVTAVAKMLVDAVKATKFAIHRAEESIGGKYLTPGVGAETATAVETAKASCNDVCR